MSDLWKDEAVHDQGKQGAVWQVGDGSLFFHKKTRKYLTYVYFAGKNILCLKFINGPIIFSPKMPSIN